MSDEYDIAHREVFRREGAFAGWPANYALWSWGQELLSIFAVGEMGPKREIHELDRGHRFVPCQARSMDGGNTWSTERFDGVLPGGGSLSADEHLDGKRKIRPRMEPGNDLLQLDRPIDFLDPEAIVLCARTGISQNSISWFYISRLRGRQWDGPFAFNGLDLPIAARTDIVALGNADALFLLTTAKSNGTEGRTFCARTRDGGRTLAFVSFIGCEPQGYRIMPSSVRFSDGAVVTATRCAGVSGDGWIEMFISHDEGVSWAELGIAVANTGKGGNPPALLQGDDGRLLVIYGFRDPPFGMRLRSSCDRGRNWNAETILRGDGGTSDIGYPRVASISEGKFTVVYYYNDGEGHDRYIAASLVEYLV